MATCEGVKGAVIKPGGVVTAGKSDLLTWRGGRVGSWLEWLELGREGPGSL